jgi:hypothetical protein
VSSRANIKATKQPVLEAGKDAYEWQILQPRTEVQLRTTIKETKQTVLEGNKDAYVLPILQPRLNVSSRKI